jgi:hypothetical protein
MHNLQEFSMNDKMMLQSIIPLMLLVTTHAASSSYRGFPYGEPCYVLDCDALAWKLQWSKVEHVDGNMVACFTISPKACRDESKYNCCKVFSNNIPKIDLSTNPSCRDKIITTTVNGVKLKKVEVPTFRNQVTKTPFSEVRLWDVNLDKSTAPGARVCLTVKPPCDDLESFCTDMSDGKCKYSVLNVNDGHTCCPTCDFSSGHIEPFPLNNPPPSSKPRPSPSTQPPPFKLPSPSKKPDDTQCGNGVCEPFESMRTCPRDCNPVCGNGLCEVSEDWTRCPYDCLRK